jgi:hypothetical protein
VSLSPETPIVAALRSDRRWRVLSLLNANGLVVGGVAALALVALAVVQAALIGDSWLALASGREIAQHGLPHHDTLFIWTEGRNWVDQQWLAQLTYYALFDVGGIRLVMFANTALFVGAGLIAFLFARRRGASPRAVFLVAILLPLIAPWAMQMRAQTMAELLFAACFGLLTLQAPLTWRRVLGVLALLVLWANVHGTVVMGAALAVLCGLIAAGKASGTERRPGLVLMFLSPLCIFASPYGFHLVGYYRELLTNPLLPKFVAEWKASSPGLLTATFYFVLLVGTWLIGRHGKRLPLYDKLALGLLAVLALSSLRSIIWFGLAAAILLTPLVDNVLGATRTLTGPIAARLGLAIGAAALVIAGFVFLSPRASFMQYWPSTAAARVAEVAARDPGQRVFADDDYADWLLWREPQLRGRIAYDVRFELLNRAEFQKLSEYRDRKGEHWRRAADGYGVFVYSPEESSCPARRCKTIYRDKDVVVAVRR